MLLSKANHPEARPMTTTAAVRTLLDNLEPGLNVFPEIIDDVTGKGSIPVANIRVHINTYKGDRKITTRVIDGSLHVFLVGDVK